MVEDAQTFSFVYIWNTSLWMFKLSLFDKFDMNNVDLVVISYLIFFTKLVSLIFMF